MSILLWFIVMNIIHPTEIRRYSVHITLLNEDKLENNEFTILNKEEIENLRVDINIKATRTALDELNKEENRKNIKATIDLQQFDLLYGGNTSEPVNLSIKPSLPSELYLYEYEIVNFYPPTASINIDNVITTKRNVAIEQIGNVRDGYISYAPEIEPEIVEIKGPATELEKISTVKAEIDLTNATSDISSAVKPIIYDSEGNILEGLNINTQTINIYIAVNKQGYLTVEKPTVSGIPAAGCKITSIEWYPKTIEVIGSESEMTKLRNITLPEIDVNEINDNKTVVFDIRPYIKGTNLNIKSGTYDEVTVNIKVEHEIEKEIEISIEDVNIEGKNEDKKINLPDKIAVKLKGLEQYIKDVNNENVKATINIENLEEGNHNVKVEFELPENISEAEDCIINVTISSEDYTSTETETTTITEEETSNVSDEEIEVPVISDEIVTEQTSEIIIEEETEE